MEELAQSLRTPCHPRTRAHQGPGPAAEQWCPQRSGWRGPCTRPLSLRKPHLHPHFPPPGSQGHATHPPHWHLYHPGFQGRPSSQLPDFSGPATLLGLKHRRTFQHRKTQISQGHPWSSHRTSAEGSLHTQPRRPLPLTRPFREKISRTPRFPGCGGDFPQPNDVTHM